MQHNTSKQAREEERKSKLFAPEIYVDASLAKPTPRTSPVALNRVFPLGSWLMAHGSWLMVHGRNRNRNQDPE